MQRKDLRTVFLCPVIKRNFKFIFVLVMLGMASFSFAQDATCLKMVKDLPVVEGSINGKTAYFLVDTGATITVLDESMARHYGFKIVLNEYFREHSIVGIGGNSRMNEARAASIELGCKKIDFVNKTCRLDKISSCFANHHIRIAGIIGTDLLSVLGCKIDFSDNTIVFNVR